MDNCGIEVKMCVFSDTIGRDGEHVGPPRILTGNRNAERAQRLHEVWLKLFSDQQVVELYDFCAGPGLLVSRHDTAPAGQ